MRDEAFAQICATLKKRILEAEDKHPLMNAEPVYDTSLAKDLLILQEEVGEAIHAYNDMDEAKNFGKGEFSDNLEYKWQIERELYDTLVVAFRILAEKFV